MTTRLHGTGVAPWVRGAPLLAVVLWGGIYPTAKLSLSEISVLGFMSLRMVLATLVFLLSGCVRPLGVWKRSRLALVNATTAQAAFQFFLVAGLQRTTAGHSAILLATAPLLTAAWLAVSGGQRSSPRRWVGLALGIVGIALIVHAPDIGLQRSRLSGDLLSLAAAGAWAWYGLAIGPLVRDVGVLTATGTTMAMASVAVVPGSLLAERAVAWAPLSAGAWVGVAYGGTVGMVAAMALWGWSIRHLGPTETMVYLYLEPVSAVVLAAVLLGESLGAPQAIGAIIAFTAVWLASDPRRRTE
jgi:drug/metabolite transporter (DMT)-like permease